MNITSYIKPELGILIPILYVVGIALKKSCIKDKLIPILLGAISIFLTSLWILATTPIACFADAALALFASITQGILLAGADVYANQMHKQMNKKE